jgi:hypothetical protein
MRPRALLIACGALARELVALQRQNGWNHLEVQCLPADLHNTPDKIPDAVDSAIEHYKQEFRHIFVAYADCGTGGMLDRVLEKHGVERLHGAHCYQFFAGTGEFEALCDEEPGTFYLTDFLVRHFDRLVMKELGIDRHPGLKEQYFGNYRRLVYLSQSQSDELADKARDCAQILGLAYAEHYTGLEQIEPVLTEHVLQWRN